MTPKEKTCMEIKNEIIQIHEYAYFNVKTCAKKYELYLTYTYTHTHVQARTSITYEISL